MIYGHFDLSELNETLGWRDSEHPDYQITHSSKKSGVTCYVLYSTLLADNEDIECVHLVMMSVFVCIFTVFFLMLITFLQSPGNLCQGGRISHVARGDGVIGELFGGHVCFCGNLNKILFIQYHGLKNKQ